MTFILILIIDSVVDEYMTYTVDWCIFLDFGIKFLFYDKWSLKSGITAKFRKNMCLLGQTSG